MKYTFGIFSFLVSVGNLVLASAAAKVGLLPNFGCALACAVWQCACARVVCTARWLALHVGRACEAPAGARQPCRPLGALAANNDISETYPFKTALTLFFNEDNGVDCYKFVRVCDLVI